VKDKTLKGVDSVDKQIKEINEVLAGLPANYAVNINPSGDVKPVKLRLASPAAGFRSDKNPARVKLATGVVLPVNVGFLA
jgi:hypothetical protein